MVGDAHASMSAPKEPPCPRRHLESGSGPIRLVVRPIAVDNEAALGASVAIEGMLPTSAGNSPAPRCCG